MFHPFPRLPFELRAQIWELTVEPRTVEIRYKREYQDAGSKVLHVTSSTPVPATLQACRDARNLRLYQRAFNAGTEPRYVWVDFEIDTISIGHTDYAVLEPARLMTRRLTFERVNDESFFRLQSKELARFSNLEEIHIICEEGLMVWQDAWESLNWPCPKENLRFIDKETGQVAEGGELDKMLREYYAILTPYY